MGTYRDYTPEEMGRQAEEIYDARIRPIVEKENKGRFVVLDVETGDWLMGADPDALADTLHQQRVDAPLCTFKIGFKSEAFVGIGAVTELC